MKNLWIILLALLPFSLSAQKVAEKKANIATEQWGYEIEPAVGQAPKGTVIVRVSSYSKNAQVAIQQAGKNAVHGILFKGVAPSNDNNRLPGVPALVNDLTIAAENDAYFRDFFNNKAYQQYVSMINNGAPESTLQVGKQWKIAILVKVQVDALRQRLESDGVLKALTVQEGKVPTVMVVPSDHWCQQHGYTTAFGNRQLPDYEKALNEDPDLLRVIANINELFTTRRFPLKNLESALKSLHDRNAERNMTTSKSGADVVSSPIDELKNNAHADIWIQIDWNLNSVAGGSKTSLTFTMQGLDSYTDKQVAGASGTGTAVYTSQAQVPIMLEEAVVGHMEPFAKQLMDYFQLLNQNGRQVKIHISLFDEFDGDLESDFDGAELNEIIEDWMAANTVNGKFNTVVATQNQMLFENVAIPLQNERGRDMDARSWLRGLQRELQNKYMIESKLVTQGLGEAELILGGK
ncbi:MAG: hypothetical protein IJR74_00935 [Paludibacteraceae bacterium]|nr:hypothetical protein [Paludibacteraceae bacterium]